MSDAFVECEGAPRDLGADQARAWFGAIRDRLARAGLRARAQRPFPRRFSGGATLGAGMGREIVRHYPHLAERLAGMASAARLSPAVLMEMQVLAAYEGGRWLPGVDDGVLAAATGHGTSRLARTLRLGPAPGERWRLRRSRPEVGFASVEIVQPWALAGVAGVNECGLALALGGPAEPARAASGESMQPPAWLLIQECLQRFDGIEGAVEWCGKRPVRPGATLALATADRLVHVRLTDRGSEVDECASGVLVSGGDPTRAAALRKRLESGDEGRAAEVLVEAALEASGQADAGPSSPANFAVVLDAAARELRIAHHGSRSASIRVGEALRPTEERAA